MAIRSPLREPSASDLRQRHVHVACARPASKRRSERLVLTTGCSHRLYALLPAALADVDGRALLDGGDRELGATIGAGGRGRVALAELDGAGNAAAYLQQGDVGLVRVEGAVYDSS